MLLIAISNVIVKYNVYLFDFIYTEAPTY